MKTYVEHKGILDDLDVRASDLLQANGIIWVEGPSDRIYLNRWIELWTSGALKEGLHYQIVFYGGRLLAHLSASDPEESNDLIKILRVNKNAVIVIDSDKIQASDSLNQTKSRLVSEINDMGGLSWVTAGREVENYLPRVLLEARYSGAALPEKLDEFRNIEGVLDGIEPDAGKKFLRNKNGFAEEVAALTTREMLAESLDLGQKLDALCDQIRRWNGLR